MKYAALVKRSIYIPGDERSRTHPGHGYPGGTEEVTDLRVFKDRADMEAWVESEERSRERYGTRTDYTLIEYRELTVKRSVSVKVD